MNMSDLYNLSDEELASVNPEETVEVEQETAEDTETVDEVTEETSNESQEESEDIESEIEDTLEDNKEESTEDTQESEESDTQQSNEIDYKAFYEAMTSPIKANGKEFQLKEIDDIRALVQQGANYSKKMAGLKPKMNLLKTLEHHGLNEENIGYLIDLHNKEPKAIAKLVQEAGIDVYGTDLEEEAKGYTPVSKPIQLTPVDEVVQDLQDTSETFPQLLNHINTWDSESIQIISHNPDILRILDKHKELGIYDKIVNDIEREKVLGRLTGVGFLQAYNQFEKPYLEELAKPKTFTGTRPKKQTTDENINKKKLAKSPNTQTTTTTVEFDPLKVSDEELERYLAQAQYH